jgi:hypothetical protein
LWIAHSRFLRQRDTGRAQHQDHQGQANSAHCQLLPNVGILGNDSGGQPRSPGVGVQVPPRSGGLENIAGRLANRVGNQSIPHAATKANRGVDFPHRQAAVRSNGACAFAGRHSICCVKWARGKMLRHFNMADAPPKRL